MTQKYCTIDEDELKELMAKVAGIQAWIRNDANIGEIQKRVNVLEYLLQKLERKLTQRAPDVCPVCRGKKGSRDAFDEWYPCQACDRTGKRR